MVERQHWYSLTVNNVGANPGYTQFNTQLRLDTDAPFRATGFAVYAFNNGTALGPLGNIGLSVRYTNPDGGFVQRNLTSAEALNVYDAQAVAGANAQSPPVFAYFSPLGQNLLYPAGSQIVVDLQLNAAVVFNKILIIFTGTKIFGDGAVWAPTYPATNTQRPFVGYSIQVAGSQMPIQNVPMPPVSAVNRDADFVWGFGSHTDSGAGGFASRTVAEEAASLMVFTAKAAGAGGNSISIELDNFGSSNLPLVITVIGNAITAQLATASFGLTSTTGAQLATALNANPAASALVSTVCSSDCGLPAPNNNAPQFLTGGGAGGGAVGSSGAAIGIRIKDAFGKAYMNDFIPLPLIFGFDNSQTPGLVYPEVYIPRAQAIYADFAAFFPPAASTTFTVTFKGRKVYS